MSGVKYSREALWADPPVHLSSLPQPFAKHTRVTWLAGMLEGDNQLNAKSLSWHPRRVNEEAGERRSLQALEREFYTWAAAASDWTSVTSEIHRKLRFISGHSGKYLRWNKLYLHHVLVHNMQLCHGAFVGFVHFHVFHSRDISGAEEWKYLDVTLP